MKPEKIVDLAERRARKGLGKLYEELEELAPGDGAIIHSASGKEAADRLVKAIRTVFPSATLVDSEYSFAEMAYSVRFIK